MTKHELAAATWQEMKEDLIDRGAFDPAFVTRRGKPIMGADESEMVDGVMIAMIENAFLGAVTAVAEENEDRLCLVDNAKLSIDKPSEGRFQVNGNCFTLTDGRLVVQPKQELVIREKHGQVFITRRQG